MCIRFCFRNVGSNEGFCCNQGREQGSAGRAIGDTATKPRGLNLRIDSSTVGMESARRYTSNEARFFKFTITGGNSATLSGQLLGNQSMNKEAQEKANQAQKSKKALSPSEKMEELRAKLNGFSSKVNFSSSVSGFDKEYEQLRTIREQCINYLYQAFFGWNYQQTQRNVDSGTSNTSGGFPEAGMSSFAMASGNFRLYEYQQAYLYTETEDTAFSTAGTVKCADGREIDFNLNLKMSRSFQEYYEETFAQTVVNVRDPLVINLDGNIADLSDQTMLFDIDSDGVKDEVNRLAQGSGYLALDKNGDGEVNDGSELFGTASGNGFADLAQYDEDGNGWIDEGDDIWSKLKIWVMDENGEGRLYGLAEKGLGAICLASQNTDFTITNANNEAKGYIRQSGTFLYESGAVGSVQQVDLAKYDHVG